MSDCMRSSEACALVKCLIVCEVGKSERWKIRELGFGSTDGYAALKIDAR